MCSALEGSNQIVSDQGVRKTLYQKVRNFHELSMVTVRLPSVRHHV